MGRSFYSAPLTSSTTTAQLRTSLSSLPATFPHLLHLNPASTALFAIGRTIVKEYGRGQITSAWSQTFKGVRSRSYARRVFHRFGRLRSSPQVFRFQRSRWKFLSVLDRKLPSKLQDVILEKI